MSLFIRTLCLLSITVFSISACSLFSPHKMEINQGTQIEQSALDKLKLGMTKEQVEFVLGSPVTKDLYAPGRWDYIEHVKNYKHKKDNINKKLALWFNGDSLERVAAMGYEVAHLQGDNAVRMANAVQSGIRNEPKRTLPTPQPVSPLPAVTTTPTAVAVATPPTPMVSVESDVQSTLDIWSSAWSAQDISTYVAQYVKGYSPSKSLRHSSWVKRRNAIISKPTFITLDLSNVQINALNDQKATAQFVQAYASDRYQDTVIKKLTLVQENGQWKIAKEKTLKKLK